MRKLATALRAGFVLQHYPFMRQQQDALNALTDDSKKRVRFVHACVPEVRGSGVLGIVESKEQAPCP